MSSSLSVESGFSRKSDGAQARGPHGHFDVGLAGDHDHRQRNPQRANLFEQREAVLAGHDHVGEHQVEGLRLHQVQRAGRVVADGGIVSGHAEGAGQGCQRIGVVIDD